MKMKRILAAVAATAMLFGMAGCSDSSSGNTDGTAAAGGDNAAADGKVYNVGICQLVEHPALDAATEGFMAALTEKLGDNVKFDNQNAQNEATNCTTICNNFVASNVDLIMANATGSLQAASSATDSIPIVGTSITNYATAMGVNDWAEMKGKNITGTSDLAPIDEQEDVILEYFPDVKQVGILYCSAEANSKYQANLMEAALTADGIAYKEYTVADSNEIQAVATTAIAECDVIYIPTDNTIANATETVKNVVVPAKIPVIAGEEGICAGCGVASLSPTYYDMGYKAGEMAYDILVNGKNAGDMDIEFAPKVEKLYNAEICESLGITPPEGYKAIGSDE
ncbi:MAG: ABC transporter substrate-binding protein [Ruminococcus sp.]|nr:ABC transporter substrate-binding protein [Ruminococcus sp.]MCM1479707.1 ABC transporter substrate-binding protein [Muribaculaceae bacterium]